MVRIVDQVMEIAVPIGSVLVAILSVVVGPSITRWLSRRAETANIDKTQAESDAVDAEARRTDVATLREVMSGIMLELERARQANTALYQRIEELEKRAIDTSALYQSKITDMQSLITTQQLHIQGQASEIARLKSHVERLERIATTRGTLP